MPREGNKIHIPLKTKDAIAGLMKVKPTADMPRMKHSRLGKSLATKKKTSKQ